MPGSTVVRILAALQKAQEDGCPVAIATEETAQLVMRRWNSSANRGIDASDWQCRVDDLAKGLIAHIEEDPKRVGPLVADYRHLAAVISAQFRLDVGKPENPALLIEGYPADELPEALGAEPEADILSGRSLVARVGSAEILLVFRVHADVLVAEIAHVDGGGEGVLPALIGLVIRLAKRRHVCSVEWHVIAATCARPAGYRLSINSWDTTSSYRSAIIAIGGNAHYTGAGRLVNNLAFTQGAPGALAVTLYTKDHGIVSSGYNTMSWLGIRQYRNDGVPVIY